MSTFQVGLLAQVGIRTVAFAAGAAALGPDQLSAPSRLPGWSRGHVLAHVTNQALALVAVLDAAAHGQVASMYPSRDERDTAIDAGASAPGPVHVEQLLSSSARLFTAWQQLPDARLDVQFTSPAGWFRPVSDALWFRWRELVLHLVDLDVEKEPENDDDLRAPDGAAGTPDPLLHRLLDETASGFAGRDGVPGLRLSATDSGQRWQLGDGSQEVSGSTASLALWLTGRGAREDLASDGPLPALPAWL